MDDRAVQALRVAGATVKGSWTLLEPVYLMTSNRNSDDSHGKLHCFPCFEKARRACPSNPTSPPSKPSDGAEKPHRVVD